MFVPRASTNPITKKTNKIREYLIFLTQRTNENIASTGNRQIENNQRECKKDVGGDGS